MQTAPAAAHAVPVPFDRVALRGFWRHWQRTVRDVAIPTQLRHLRDSGRIDAFTLSWKPGQANEPHVFWDSDVAKWLEAASYALALERDETLAREVDALARLIASAQQADGYLNTHFTVVRPGARWANTRDDHELYCAGHLIEAAVAHHAATGDRVLLDALRRYAACIRATFGVEPGKRRGYCGHEEIELALIRLWRATGDREHLDLARYFIDERGRDPNWFAIEAAARGETRRDYDAAYCQAAVPVRELADASGHAVRFAYLCCAMADLAAETGDATLMPALERLWTSATARRMYVTGGIGSSHRGEAFTSDFDLPNREAYCETCAAIGLAMWAHRMLRLAPDARYADVLERALYNGALAGLSRDGRRCFYVNPLASDGTHRRQDWFGCACCPPNIARLIASLGGYAYATRGDELWVHLYEAGEARVELGGVAATLVVETAYPWDGRVRLRLRADRPFAATLRLRAPGWCRAPRLTVDGAACDAPLGDGYFRIARTWRGDEAVELELPMPVERVHAHPAVRADRGRVALMRGPLVYCVEGCDNGDDLDALVLPRAAAFAESRDPDVLDGAVVLDAEAAAPRDGDTALYRREPTAVARRPLRAVPYFAWDNRAPGEMAVWLRETG